MWRIVKKSNVSKDNIIRNYIENAKAGMIAALLVFIVFLTIFIIRGRILGKYTFMHSDLAAQYASVAKLFLRQLFVDHNLIYSWEVSMGSDTLPLYTFYSCFSPFTFIYALNLNIDILSFGVTVGKLCLAAFTFVRFIQKKMHTSMSISIILGMYYALCGFSMAYYFNMIWFDGLYMLPVIIGLILDVRENKNYIFLKLAIAYSYIFIVNFYSGYVIGLFSGLIFLLVVVFFVETIKQKLMSALKFILCVLSSSCISMIVIYPTAMAMLKNVADDGFGFDGLYLNIFDIFKQLFMCQLSGRELGRFPYIYSGLLSLVFVSLYLLNKEVKKSDKVIVMSILCVFILSCLNPAIYIGLHLFDAPDSYGFRFSYIIVFLMVSLAALGYKNVEKVKKKQIVVIIIFLVVINVVCELMQHALYGFSVNYLVLIINGIFLGLYGLILLNIKKRRVKLCLHALVVVSALEIIVNGVSYDEINVKATAEEKELYAFYNDQVKGVVDTLNECDNSFYRIKVLNTLYCNDSMKFNYKSIGLFSSYQHQNLRRTLSKLGYTINLGAYEDCGATDLMTMLTGEKYEVITSGWTDFLDRGYYKEYDYWLPIGYMVSSDVQDLSLDGNNVFENQNRLLNALVGEDVGLYYDVGNSVEINCYNASKSFDDTGLIYEVINQNEAGVVEFCDKKDLMKYVYFEVPDNMENLLSPVITNSDMDLGPLVAESYLYSPHILEINESDEFGSAYIVFGDKRMLTAGYNQAYFYGEHDELIEEIYSKLNDNGIAIEKYKDGYIYGNINVEEGENVLFTTIPYQDGWKIYVDGKKVDIIPLVDGAFLGAKIEKGNHSIVLKYYDKNINVGIVMMLMGVLLLGMLCLAEKKPKKR